MNTSPTPIAELVRTNAPAACDSLSLQEAANRCGKSRSWLTKLQSAGLAPHSIKVGRERRYLKADLDSWLARRSSK